MRSRLMREAFLMTAQYKIILESPLGERCGSLSLCEEGDTVSGKLELLGFENSVTGKKSCDCFNLKHTLHTAVSVLQCSTMFFPRDGTIFVAAHLGKLKINMRGTAFAEETRP